MKKLVKIRFRMTPPSRPHLIPKGQTGKAGQVFRPLDRHEEQPGTGFVDGFLKVEHLQVTEGLD